MKTVYLTKDGKRKIEEELNFLKGIETKRLIEAIQDARDKGDVSENAEYESAKAEYELLQIRIAKLDETLSNGVVIQRPSDISKVGLLTTVVVRDLKTSNEVCFTIVPENEIDIKTKKISPNSPIGQGLMEKKVGDKTSIKIPNGIIEYQILEIKVGD